MAIIGSTKPLPNIKYINWLIYICKLFHTPQYRTPRNKYWLIEITKEWLHILQLHDPAVATGPTGVAHFEQMIRTFPINDLPSPEDITIIATALCRVLRQAIYMPHSHLNKPLGIHINPELPSIGVVLLAEFRELLNEGYVDLNKLIELIYPRAEGTTSIDHDLTPEQINELRDLILTKNPYISDSTIDVFNPMVSLAELLQTYPLSELPNIALLHRRYGVTELHIAYILRRMTKESATPQDVGKFLVALNQCQLLSMAVLNEELPIMVRDIVNLGTIIQSRTDLTVTFLTRLYNLWYSLIYVFEAQVSTSRLETAVAMFLKYIRIVNTEFDMDFILDQPIFSKIPVCGKIRNFRSGVVRSRVPEDIDDSNDIHGHSYFPVVIVDATRVANLPFDEIEHSNPALTYHADVTWNLVIHNLMKQYGDITWDLDVVSKLPPIRMIRDEIKIVERWILGIMNDARLELANARHFVSNSRKISVIFVQRHLEQFSLAFLVNFNNYRLNAEVFDKCYCDRADFHRLYCQCAITNYDKNTRRTEMDERVFSYCNAIMTIHSTREKVIILNRMRKELKGKS